MDDKFKYEYNAPSMEERKEIDSIRRQYLPKDKTISKLDRLKALDRKVKNVSLIFPLTFGVVGLLLFGTSMTFFIEWIDIWYIGIPFAILGIPLMIIAYPSHLKILSKMKEKYSKEILELSDELLKDNN